MALMEGGAQGGLEQTAQVVVDGQNATTQTEKTCNIVATALKVCDDIGRELSVLLFSSDILSSEAKDKYYYLSRDVLEILYWCLIKDIRCFYDTYLVNAEKLKALAKQASETEISYTEYTLKLSELLLSPLRELFVLYTNGVINRKHLFEHVTRNKTN